jgi:hypothetical protein
MIRYQSLHWSAANLMPLTVLSYFRHHPDYARTIVESQVTGAIGLRFTQQLAAGLRAPPFPKPMSVVTCWLDEAKRITSVVYEDTYQKDPATVYAYTYPAQAQSTFLQPTTVVRQREGRLTFTVEITDVRANVYLPPDALELD